MLHGNSFVLEVCMIVVDIHLKYMFLFNHVVT